MTPAREDLIKRLEGANEHTPKVLSAWHPMGDETDLAALGKLLEELNECGSAAARCIIQGGTWEAEPVTGKLNRQWLIEEIADVLAMIETVSDRFDLDRNFIQRRKEGKIAHMQAWFALLRAEEYSV